MINGNDGGATISVDGGTSWTTQYNQPTAQFYHVATDNQFLYYVYGAQQDNSTVAIASRADDGYIGRQHWHDVGGGESGYVVPDPRDANIVYAGCGRRSGDPLGQADDAGARHLRVAPRLFGAWRQGHKIPPGVDRAYRYFSP